jgi:hypothetical protein
MAKLARVAEGDFDGEDVTVAVGFVGVEDGLSDVMEAQRASTSTVAFDVSTRGTFFSDLLFEQSISTFNWQFKRVITYAAALILLVFTKPPSPPSSSSAS